jgi:hypothetical protein
LTWGRFDWGRFDWERFDLGPIWLEMVKNRLHILKDNFILYLMIAQCWPEAYLFIVGHWQFNPPSYLLIAYNSITPTNFTIYIIYLTILKSFYYYSALVSNLNRNNVLFVLVADCQKLWLSLIGYDQIQRHYH